MNKFTTAGAVALLAFASIGAAQATVVDLNFEGIASYPSGNNVQILDYYNGGTSSVGTSGTNYGISFSDNALVLCLNSTTITCSNTSRGGQGDPASQEGGLYFLNGTGAILNDAAGFTTGFSFNYSDVNTAGGVVNVYDGLNGTGNLLATLVLPLTPSGCSGYPGAYCPFVAAGVTFAGTAKSIDFGGVANFVVFDDVTFGSSTPGNPVPEPITLALFGAGLAGLAGLRRRRKKAA